VQVHLLDATYELFRSHFAPRPQALDPTGHPINATVGIIESTLYLLREEGVTHLGCAADHVIESWRNDRWPGYKTSFGVPRELLDQFTLAEDALRALGIVVWPLVEWEADDGLGTAAARWAEAPDVERVVIMTPDKDMGQCVREDGKVVQFDRRQRLLIDADGVRKKFGVSPESIPDYLALVGDSADGYPGIPGWGKVSAGVVLTRYRHLEEIPESVRDWDVTLRGAAALATSLREHRSEAFLFRELATLVLDVPLPETLDDLRWRGAHRAEFTALAERLGQPQLVGRVHKWAD
jgi:5'-3' exonuclease